MARYWVDNTCQIAQVFQLTQFSDIDKHWIFTSN